MRSFVPKTRAGVRPERAATVIAALVLACSTAEVTGPNESIETILVAPPTATVAVGATLLLDAEVRTATGDVIGGQRVSWASEDAGIAEVSSTGVVTGLKVGTVLIAASARGHDAFARVTVNPTPVASVRLSSTHQSLLVGQVAQLTADPLDASGRLLENRQLSWTSTDDDIATVTESGLVTALSPGGAIITVTAEGRSVCRRSVSGCIRLPQHSRFDRLAPAHGGTRTTHGRAPRETLRSPQCGPADPGAPRTS